MSDSVVLLKQDEPNHNDYVDGHGSKKGRNYKEAVLLVIRSWLPEK